MWCIARSKQAIAGFRSYAARVKLHVVRLALPLLLANYVAFGVFLALRPSAADRLREKDSASERGEFSISSADPYTYIAARPLYNWSEWHGGEHPTVKMLEIANLPALLAASSLTPVVGTITGASVHHGWSYVRAALFLLFATGQWLTIGRWLSRRAHTPPSTAA